MLQFLNEQHKYESTDGSNIDWISVTSFVKHFAQPFDQKEVAIKSSKNRKSKWYKMDPDKIIEVWEKISKDAIEKGTFYHNEREADICATESLYSHGKHLPIVKPIFNGGIKIAPDQKLTDGIYPEHMVYLKSVGLCGQSDLVEVVDGRVYILDYKTNREINTESYKDWEGRSKRMNAPLFHLDCCNLNHYTLQLSLYMYMILKHNPQLEFGGLTIHHILFEEVGKDEYGYPITALQDGKPIVKEVVPYDVPYLKTEVVNMINYLKTNRSKIKTKK